MDKDERDFIRSSAARIEEWEKTPRDFEDPYSDMTSEEKSRLIMLLQKDKEQLSQRNEETVRRHEETVSRLNALLKAQEETNSTLRTLTLMLAERDTENAALRQQLSEALQAVEDLRQRQARDNQSRYGRKSQKRKGAPKQPPSHEQNKQDHDGTPESVDHEAVPDPSAEETPKKPRSTAQMRADILRKGSSYRTMEADNTVCHPSDLSRLPEGAQIIKTISRYGYEQKVSVIEHEYQLVVYKTGNAIATAYLPCDGEPEIIDIVPGTHASAEMLANLAYSRFTLDVPLYRQNGHLRDEGFRLSRKTLTNWLYKGSLLLTPVIEELKRIALEKDSIVNCDETWCRVKVFEKYRRRYIWCLVNKEARIVIYCYEDGSRGRKALREILKGAQLKALQTDGYNVYLYLDKELLDIDHICCMAHARAKFKYAADAGDKDAEYMLGCMGELYALEDLYRQTGLEPVAIKTARNSTQTIEIIGRLRSKLNVLLAEGHPPRGELMEKAVRYLDNYWTQIFRYTKDGRYHIDNNIAERFIKPLAGERKNSLFFGSHRMARASAIFHTVISTCRISGLSALEYLRRFFRKVVDGVTDYSLLLPQTIGLSANKC